jgi:hypothetical protein
MTMSVQQTGEAVCEPGSHEAPRPRRLTAVTPPDLAVPPGDDDVASGGRAAEAPTDGPAERTAAAPPPAGPLVAVCGLCGGAGVSTLSYLIARSAVLEAGHRSGPVLALDAGGMTGGLSLYAGEASLRSLAELADDITRGHPPTSMFITAVGGVRLIATAPRPQPEPDLGVVSRILTDAREAHHMTVVDCGTLTLPGERLALELATHVIWVLPASEHGVSRARLSTWSVPRSDVVQVVVARRDPAARKAPTRDLAQLAEAREAALVLMPHVKSLEGQPLDNALEVCAVTLQALAMKLRQ